MAMIQERQRLRCQMEMGLEKRGEGVQNKEQISNSLGGGGGGGGENDDVGYDGNP